MSRVLAAFRCETCGGPVERGDLRPEHGVAVCSLCHAVLLLPAPKAKPLEQRAAPWDFETLPDRVCWRNPRWGAVTFAGLCVAWVSFIFGSAILTTALGAIFAYAVLVHALNRHVIFREADMIRVRYGPLPWLGGDDLHVSSVGELRVFESTTGESGTPVCGVVAVSPGGTPHVLADGMSERARAERLALELRWLLTADPGGGAKPGSGHPTLP